ncbi:MAG: 2-amino-4-hydroxy-6-hydroxymethyldihydropteridine diphosphokinase [Raineya sp.]
MNQAYILLGSNQGNKVANLQVAFEAIKSLGDIKRTSSIYETAAWGWEEQESFLNQVLELDTLLSPENLLRALLKIEEEMGRKRVQKWAARIIDIDILYVGQAIVQRENLQIPHPYLHLRRFTLVPLCEIATNFKHPIFGKTTQELLEECPDTLEVNLLCLKTL